MKQKLINILEPLWTVCIVAGITLTVFTTMQIESLIFLVLGLIFLLVDMWIADRKHKESDTIYFAKLKPNAIIPSKREEDGCLDIYACIDEPVIIPPHTNKLIPTGIASAFNSKYRIAFRERGSNTKSNLIVMAGQIDSGYKGEYFVSLFNGNDIPVELTNTVMELEKTEDFIRVPISKAICQFAVEPVPQVKIKEITYNQIKEFKSNRGISCLGGSGK